MQKRPAIVPMKLRKTAGKKGYPVQKCPRVAASRVCRLSGWWLFCTLGLRYQRGREDRPYRLNSGTLKLTKESSFTCTSRGCIGRLNCTILKPAKDLLLAYITVTHQEHLHERSLEHYFGSDSAAPLAGSHMTWGLQVTQVQAGIEEHHQVREVEGGRRRRGEGTNGFHLQ